VSIRLIAHRITPADGTLQQQFPVVVKAACCRLKHVVIGSLQYGIAKNSDNTLPMFDTDAVDDQAIGMCWDTRRETSRSASSSTINAGILELPCLVLKTFG
jgi:hypothetical protein